LIDVEQFYLCRKQGAMEARRAPHLHSRSDTAGIQPDQTVKCPKSAEALSFAHQRSANARVKNSTSGLIFRQA
jgi:hypothetical protein